MLPVDLGDRKAKSEKLQGGRDMPTRPNRCEGCPDPPSNKLPIRSGASGM